MHSLVSQGSQKGGLAAVATHKEHVTPVEISHIMQENVQKVTKDRVVTLQEVGDEEISVDVVIFEVEVEEVVGHTSWPTLRSLRNLQIQTIVRSLKMKTIRTLKSMTTALFLTVLRLI